MNDGLADLLELENYEVKEELGRGQYGSVRRVFDRLRLSEFAMKIVESDKNTGVPPSILKEVAILRELDHPQIVRLQDVIFCNSKICILFELAEADLHKQIYSRPKMSLRTVRKVAYQLFLGLTELHRLRILHRDLKPANILCFPEGDAFAVKIADFGISRVSSVPVKAYTNDVVTLWYRAPELLLGSQTYNDRIDVWSIGCIIAEMIAKKPLFPGKDPEDQLKIIAESIDFSGREKDLTGLHSLPLYPRFKELCLGLKGSGLSALGVNDPDCLALLADCLELDPSRRPSAKQATEHPWFRAEREEQQSDDLLFNFDSL